MRDDTVRFLSDLTSSGLFRHIGQPCSIGDRALGSWPEALQSVESENWSALQLMTKNRNANVLRCQSWERSEEWNGLCAELRPSIAALIEASVSQVPTSLEITQGLRASVSWDVLCIMLEKEFDDVSTPFFYLPRLYPIYAAGHLPCGWTGAKLDTYWSSGSDPLPAGQIVFY